MTQTSSSAAAGRFSKQDFRYHADTNTYRCPADEVSTRRISTLENDEGTLRAR